MDLAQIFVYIFIGYLYLMPLPPLAFSGVTYMKHINVKRIFLNIGLTLAVLAAGFAVHQLYENSFLVKTTGTVYDVRVVPNCFYQDENGNEQNMIAYDIDYTTKQGQKCKDNTFGHIGEHEIGDTVEIIYDKREPESIAYRQDNLFFIIAFGVPAALLIFFCRSAFKGYKTEYLDRYRKTVIFSVISGWIPVLYFIWYEFFFEPSGEMFAGLGEALLCMFLFAAVPVINIIVWIISAVLYCRRCRKNERSVGENGSA